MFVDPNGKFITAEQHAQLLCDPTMVYIGHTVIRPEVCDSAEDTRIITTFYTGIPGAPYRTLRLNDGFTDSAISSPNVQTALSRHDALIERTCSTLPGPLVICGRKTG